jgi:uncharacterized membrane protein
MDQALKGHGSTMEAWLHVATEHAVVLIDWMALLLIAIGTIEAFVNGLRAMLTHPRAIHETRAVWLRYARWLVAGLTFQLAADILETAIAPSWQDVGRLAAIAAIRTFLNYFLERDLGEVLKRENETAGRNPPTSRADP